MPRFKKAVKGAYTNEDLAKRKVYLQGLADYEGINTTPPAWLDDRAKQIYKDLLAADKLENLKQIDQTILATYAQTYSNIIEDAEHIKKEGQVVEGKLSPYFRSFNQQTVQLNKLGNTLGITPQSRARIEMNRAKNHEADSGKTDPFLKVVEDHG